MYLNTAWIFIRKRRRYFSKITKNSRRFEGVKSVSSLAGYEILTETGSNAGTCLINLKDWNDRKQSVVEIMAELEENLKVYQVQILNFFNRQRYLVIAAGGF
jgi:HAE1 family hydrophobic/amphiphilic exporter-1